MAPQRVFPTISHLHLDFNYKLLQRAGSFHDEKRTVDHFLPLRVYLRPSILLLLFSSLLLSTLRETQSSPLLSLCTNTSVFNSYPNITSASIERIPEMARPFLAGLKEVKSGEWRNEGRPLVATLLPRWRYYRGIVLHRYL